MSEKAKFSIGPLRQWLAFIGVLAVMAAICLTQPLQEMMDNFRLAKFAQKIATTDHIVALEWTLYPSRKEMSLSLTGEDAKRIVRVISSGRANRSLDMSQRPAKVTFFHGTNVLAEILTDGELFAVDDRRYLDVTFKLDANSRSGLLGDLIDAPLRKMVQEAEMKEIGSQ